MNKKAQLGGIIYVLLVIVLAGFILALFQPTINEFRLERVNELDMYPDQDNLLIRILLYALNPILWIFYILLSVFVLFISTRSL